MIQSLYQIDFVRADTGTSTRLLSAGEKTDVTLQFGFEQSATTWKPVGSDYGFTTPLGGARFTLEWQRVVEHASHAVAAGYAISHPASLPKLNPGKIRVTITGGQTWDLLAAVILGASCRPHVGFGFRTLTGYRCEYGTPVLVP
jgi:hypothetical protein